MRLQNNTGHSNEKEEAYIGGAKEVAGVYLKRFFPSIFSNVVRKVKVR